MSLPWIQVDALAVEQHAPMLARLLRIEESLALGSLVFLWRWAADRAEKFPTGHVPGAEASRVVEAAARWGGKPGALTGALKQLGLVEESRGGLRIKGLDRYAATHARRRQAATRQRRRRSLLVLLRSPGGDSK